MTTSELLVLLFVAFVGGIIADQCVPEIQYLPRGLIFVLGSISAPLILFCLGSFIEKIVEWRITKDDVKREDSGDDDPR